MGDWLLAVDASTPRCVVVLGRVGEGPAAALHADEQDDDGRRASAELHLRIARLLEAAAIGPADLAWLGCGRGPGTFTGTRVAIAMCKGLAEATGRPLAAISTLAAVAGSVEGHAEVLAVLDARRGEVYAGAFACDGGWLRPVDVERCCAIEVALAAAPHHHVVGPGVSPNAARVPVEFAATPLPGPTARGLWRAAVSAHAQGGPGDAAAVEATYLRDSYAELGMNVAKRPVFRSPLV